RRRSQGRRTLYLNAEIGDYVDDRLRAPERAARLRDRLRPHLCGGRTVRRFETERLPGAPPWPVAIHARRLGDGYVLAAELNVTTGERAVDWAPLRASPAVRVRVRLPGAFLVRDLRQARDLGEATTLDVAVSLAEPAFFHLRPPR
ncbi:MAG TPA: hypothetical protein VEI02_10695, partial [Planctomycetota bacterium]|nr:hypothetical protein [Planctomycetota bacterium]